PPEVAPRAPSFFRIFSTRWLRRAARKVTSPPKLYGAVRPSLEALEIRLTPTRNTSPMIVQAGRLPAHGRTAGTPHPDLPLQFSEAIAGDASVGTGIFNPANYLIFDSFSNKVTVDSVEAFPDNTKVQRRRRPARGRVHGAAPRRPADRRG